MKLGAYTFLKSPGANCRLIQPRKRFAAVETYTAVAAFTWPATIAGFTLQLSWRLMPSAMWSSLDTLYGAGAALVFDPEDASGKTYNVEIADLSGGYFLHLVGDYRQHVTMDLLFLSEV